MSTAIHQARGLIQFDDEVGRAATAAVVNEAEPANAGDVRRRQVRPRSTRQVGGSMPRPLWIYYERL